MWIKVTERLYKRTKAIIFFFSILWGKLDTVEIEEGKVKVLRIDCATAWTLSKNIWLTPPKD